ncbi:MAG TPA: hypothetical protein VIC26_04170 [Marinagarivorans sp.]
MRFFTFNTHQARHHLTLRCMLVASCLWLCGCGDTSDGPAYTPPSSASSANASTSTSSAINASTSAQSSAATSTMGSSSSASAALSATFIDPDSNQGVAVELEAQTTSLPPRTATEIVVSFKTIYAEPINLQGTLTASSSCITANNATINFPSELTGAEITASYQAKTGCVGDDIITFSGSWNGATYSVPITLNIEKDPLSNIEWVSTEPAQISIRGSGGQESAFITFALRGYNGENIVGEEITFNIEGAAGGANVINNRAMSDQNGEVRVQVRAGTAPSNVTVLATHTPTGESAPSSNLIVASGIAIEGNVTLATSVINPLGYERIGSQTATLTINATDRSGNPVPNGTSANFISEEGGNVTPSCSLNNGSCSVTFTPNGLQPANGRVQILAIIKGGEGFEDRNGNKIFDDGDVFEPAKHEAGEPYSDNNENGIYDIGEHFTDTNNDGIRTEGNGLWNGPNCQHSTLCDDSDDFIDLGVQMTLILSDGRYPTICNPGDFDVETLAVAAEGNISLGDLYLSDGNNNASNDSPHCPLGNPLPKGTSITFKASNGRLIGNARWVVPDTRDPTGPYGIVYKAPSEPGLDVLTLEIAPPLSNPLVYQWDINVQGL